MLPFCRFFLLLQYVMESHRWLLSKNRYSCAELVVRSLHKEKFINVILRQNREIAIEQTKHYSIYISNFLNKNMRYLAFYSCYF